MGTCLIQKTNTQLQEIMLKTFLLCGLTFLLVQSYINPTLAEKPSKTLSDKVELLDESESNEGPVIIMRYSKVTRNGKPHLARFEREKRATKNHARNQVNQQELEFINQLG